MSTNTNENNNRMCNCVNKEQCPLQQHCLVENVVYEATVNSNIANYEEKKNIGLCEKAFKKRFTAHKSSFNLERYRNSTSLSSEVWRLKDLNGQPNVTWKILRKSNAYSPETQRCNLCLAEKFEIANFPGKKPIKQTIRDHRKVSPS